MFYHLVNPLVTCIVSSLNFRVGWFAKRVLKLCSVNTTLSLVRFAVFCCYGRWIHNGFPEAMAIHRVVGRFSVVSQFLRLVHIHAGL